MEEVKNWLEIVYFLSGPVIVVIAYLALGQIRVAKEQIEEQRKSLRVTSRRDALKLTAEQVTLYSDKILPLQNILNKKIEEEGIEILDKFSVEFDSGDIIVTPPEEDFSYEDFCCFAQEFVDVTNAMESFCTYFTSGVADEEIAYLSLGETFCSSMKRLVPILIPVTSRGRQFSAILEIYNIWGTRFESEVLEKQKLEIENKLKSKKKTSIKVVGGDA